MSGGETIKNIRGIIPGEVRALVLEKVSAIYSASPRVDVIYLFGSYANGAATYESDIDLAVFVSGDSSFFLDEYKTFSRICRSTEYDFQVQVFSSSELDEPCGIISEVVDNGLPIIRADIDAAD